MLSEGKQAPDSRGRTQDGEPVRLSSFRGSPVVLYFYPASTTRVRRVTALHIRRRLAPALDPTH